VDNATGQAQDAPDERQAFRDHGVSSHWPGEVRRPAVQQAFQHTIRMQTAAGSPAGAGAAQFEALAAPPSGTSSMAYGDFPAQGPGLRKLLQLKAQLSILVMDGLVPE